VISSRAKILKSVLIGATIEAALATCFISGMGLDSISASGSFCLVIHAPAIFLTMELAKVLSTGTDSGWRMFLIFPTQAFLFSCIIWFFLAWRSRRKPAK
jgi:hypothetical protein